MYTKRQEAGFPKSNAGTAGAEVKIFVSGSYAKSTPIPDATYDVDIAVTVRHQVEQTERERAKQAIRDLADSLCEKHKAICIDENVLGGVPRLKGFRVSVPHILTHLYHLGSVDAVVENFEQRISKEQVREAIAYAHDFMEIACDPSEDDD